MDVPIVLAALVALAGLILLGFVRPDVDEGYRLQGTVIDDRGSRSTVKADVTLVARDVKKGDVVNVSVFWDGTVFVAIPS
jgi:hypothetical protein